MPSWLPGSWLPGSGEAPRLELRVLAAVDSAHATVPALARALATGEPAVSAAVSWAIAERLLEAEPGSLRLRLTERGEGARDAYAALQGLSGPSRPPAPPAYDPRGLATRVGELGAAARQGHETAMERARAGQLVDAAAREHAVEVVNHAYARGAMDPEDREDRVSAALAARTRGELVEAVSGLGPPAAVLPPPITGRSLAAAARRDQAVRAAAELRRTLLAVAAAGTALSVVLVLVIVLVLVL